MTRDSSILWLYVIAHELNVPVGVVRDMPLNDYNGHIAFMQHRESKRK